MTYAPDSYKNARAYVIAELGIAPSAVGIVGSAAHVAAGTSYHLGRDQLKMAKNPYSVALARDKRGLSNGAAALDLGTFTKKYAKGTATLPHLSGWLVAQCQAGAIDAAWIREIIYTTDGKTVLRYDHARGRTSAPKAGESDDSHLWHTHLGGYRDAEGVDKTAIFRRYVATLTTGTGTTPAPSPAAPAFPGRPLVYTAGKPMLTGADVRTWQAQMAKRGWAITVDGVYGPKSKDVATAFQKEKRLQVDGVVGPQTWAAAWTAPIT